MHISANVNACEQNNPQNEGKAWKERRLIDYNPKPGQQVVL